MNENDISMNRTDKIVNTFLDVSADAMTKWGSEFIQINVPQVLDGILNKFKEKIKLISEKELKQQENILPSMDTFLKGIDCGEWRKEMALIYGMKKVGLGEDKIRQILECAQQAWEPMESTNVDNSHSP